ncbi:MAG: superoxide dismutase [Candidatus Thermoplasmatota archaeon]|nr:superoxide dismutase [Candidatus Thermoplasmatota archaeon]
MTYDLPNLPYDYDALEPHIDALTMEIHHTKHHNAYTNNLNAAIGANGISDMSIGDLLRNHSDIAAIRNNGGGWWNHSQFWEAMSPDGGGLPTGDLAAAIDTAFGSFTEFQDSFQKAAMTRFGSGWAWLGVGDDGLCVCSTPNQDNPLMDECCKPILGLDVWEHAYYKKYGPGRATYIEAWWNVVDWNEVSRRYEDAI